MVEFQNTPEYRYYKQILTASEASPHRSETEIEELALKYAAIYQRLRREDQAAFAAREEDRKKIVSWQRPMWADQSPAKLTLPTHS